MALEPTKPESQGLARRLMGETGITEAQALDLISMIGWNWSSLIREAKEMRPSQRTITAL